MLKFLRILNNYFRFTTVQDEQHLKSDTEHINMLKGSALHRQKFEFGNQLAVHKLWYRQRK